MNFKSITVLFLFLFFGLICRKYYLCVVKGFCDVKTVEKQSTPSPIKFYKDSTGYVLNGFESFADSIAELSKQKKIDIVGYYSSEEVDSENPVNIGIQRATILRNLLKSKGADTNNISLLGLKKKLDFDKGLTIATQIDTSVAMDVNSSDVQLVTHYGITEIYFPNNSKDEIKSAALDSFLANLARTSGSKTIYLIGHSDNVGDSMQNIELSKERSISIKNTLLKLGVQEEHLICEGKGSAFPKVENNSPENMALNRRVELRVE